MKTPGIKYLGVPKYCLTQASLCRRQLECIHCMPPVAMPARDNAMVCLLCHSYVLLQTPPELRSAATTSSLQSGIFHCIPILAMDFSNQSFPVRPKRDRDLDDEDSHARKKPMRRGGKELTDKRHRDRAAKGLPYDPQRARVSIAAVAPAMPLATQSDDFPYDLMNVRDRSSEADTLYSDSNLLVDRGK